MPDALRKPVGGALFGYAIIYTVQVVFHTFYSDVLPPGDVYRILNYLTAAGILVSVAVVWTRKTGARDAAAGRYLAAQAGFYCALALAILFFALWFRLLNLADGESLSQADNVAWYLVAVLNPLVLGTVGAGLWRSAGKE
ncbi:MAG: hypothetical protein OXM57_08765 [bacterium]|nr:hypothetical protein [bacterium]MDE0352771.1 hypothetical protein [bacterium]